MGKFYLLIYDYLATFSIQWCQLWFCKLQELVTLSVVLIYILRVKLNMRTHCMTSATVWHSKAVTIGKGVWITKGKEYTYIEWCFFEPLNCKLMCHFDQVCLTSAKILITNVLKYLKCKSYPNSFLTKIPWNQPFSY